MADKQVDEIKQKIDIVSLIGERVTLKKSGRNFKGLCPFHGEKSPSFFVTPDMQMYKCFGCGKAGDIFNFVMEFEGLTFPEALEQLAAKSGVTLIKRERTSSELQRERVIELLHLAAEYFHFLLTEHQIGRKALHYIKERGISNQMIKDFKIGYSVDSWDALQQFLIKKKKYTTEELLAAGMIIKSDRGSYYDRFRGRLMFPLSTYAGKIVGFSGRTLDPVAKEAKYINSPETDYYHKSELLFGMVQAKRAIRDKDRIIVVEGEFDVLSCHQIGLKEVVAIKGSALTDEQAGFIRRLTHNVILSLDADAAGQEAIKRAIGVCEGKALNLRVVRLSGGKDPDELATSNPTVLKEMVQQAQSVYGYLIESACEQYDVSTGEGKKRIVQAVMPELTKIDHAVEREFYIKKLAETIRVSEASLIEEFSKTKRSLAVGVKPADMPVTAYNRREMLERHVIGLALQTHYPVRSLDNVDINWFQEPHLRRLMEMLKQANPDNKGIEIVRMLPEAIKPLAQDVFTMNVGWLEETQESLAALLAETKNKLELAWAKQCLVTMSKQMGQDSISEAEQLQLQQTYRQVASRMRELSIEGGRNG